jgi:hypothetical protein
VWSSKDLSLVIFLSVVSFIYTLSIGQLGTLITGIVGLNYFFVVGHAIFISFGLLMYEGRRWRFSLQGAIVGLLFIPTFAAGTPFDVLARMPVLITNLFVDLILNSTYSTFQKSNKLSWWGILGATFAIFLLPFFTVLNMYLFYPPEMLESFVYVVTLLLPVILIEAFIGGYLGFKIYYRLKKIH